MSHKTPPLPPADTSLVNATTILKESRSVPPEHSRFCDIEAIWELLDSGYYLLEDNKQSKATMKCIKESENVYISFLQYT
jgi:hypothetical protein